MTHMATFEGLKPLMRKPQEDIIPLPDLIEIQTDSYDWFCETGLRELFSNFSPIEDYTGNMALEFLDYRIGEPKKSIEECKESDSTFEAPLFAKVRLVNKETGEIKESEVYMGELPQMTERGTFLVNGAERVVISQLARSPGVYFRDTIDSSGRVLYAAQIIPNEGAWVEVDTAASGAVSVKIGQTRKFPVTTLLRALDSFDVAGDEDVPRTGTTPEILECFGTHEEVPLKDLLKRLAQTEEAGMPGVETQDVYYSLERVVDPEGEVLVEPYGVVTEKAVRELGRIGRKELSVLGISHQLYVTLEDDDTHTSDEGLLDVYRKIRPGDPPTLDSAESLLRSYFFDVKRYDLSRVGRYKMNRKLNLGVDGDIHTLTRQDIIAIVRYLLGLPRGEGTVDDIDHLQNKRVRAVGELLQNQLRTGFLRMERVARERMTSVPPEQMIPQAVISIKPVDAAINSFFGSGQLSQFMDQINPLAELAHKRRLSALGPGGLSKQSAKLEVRDVHHSYYGRICPIETPEGPNVGLIGYLALHARVDEYGFIKAPYRRVVKGKVTDQVDYLTADEEEEFFVATASEQWDENGRLIGDLITCRQGGKFPAVAPDRVDYIDVTAKQVFSVATSLIPFLENDDAVRALAGSNMQRQAVPLLYTKGPWIRTGMEERTARDSGAVTVAPGDGRVLEADADHIKLQLRDGSEVNYKLQKFTRTNMGTCINQHGLVRRGDRVRAGQPIIDGTATKDGSLALGKNLLVCFLPWEGYNFEDAVLISERLVMDDELTSVHVEKYECEARDTKLGPEEITRDIPNVGDDALKDLDAGGVVRVGAEVRAEDILVGKVAPKGQSELTAEEKLVIAIFGKKAEEMRDVSLRVPHGEKGIVIATKVFSRYKYHCDKCEADFDFGKQLEYPECPRCDARLRKLAGDELRPGVNQMVRVYVAQRRKVMVGDKLTGRHGNKGVISKILPIEDMPYMADGTPIDICLNPLGVPSRMNIGQLLETHLGFVARQFAEVFYTPVFEAFSAKELRGGLGAVQEHLKMESLRSYCLCELNFHGAMVRIDEPFSSADALLADLRRQMAGRSKEELEPVATYLAIDPEDFEKASPAEAVEAILKAACENAWERAQYDGHSGKMVLYDGRTGERFNQPVMVGVMYILKLHHLVEDKIHARSTGPYSLITQQPLGGKAQMGGQRFGEMEVWALEAYGAAYSLQEVLTVKSDDIQGRVATYEAIVKDENIREPGIPESFKILVREMQSLALDVKVENREGQLVDLGADIDDGR
jgi:DNA-directed RNA polymerase subunit beta